MEMVTPAFNSAANFNLNSVLVATDFSKASETALRHGFAIARYFGGRLYLAHVVSSLGFGLVGPDSLIAAKELARRGVEQLENSLSGRAAFGDIQHQTIIRRGKVWEELKSVIEQQSIDLVVVGTHGRQGLGKLLFGSVSERVFRETTSPVLTIGPYSAQESNIDQPRGRPIVFATDFGPSSMRALRYIIPFVNRRASKLILIHVFSVVPVPEAHLHWSTANDVIKLQTLARALCKHQLERVIAQSSELFREPELIVEFGPPAERILRIAETCRAEAIVLGLDRVAHTTTSTQLRWRAAYELASRACCPVLTLSN
jgi:nucleotide-binding universal stress UspA family protein